MELALPFFGSRSRAVDVDGTLHPDFAPVADRLRSQLAESDGGAAVCVYHRGRKVVDLWGLRPRCCASRTRQARSRRQALER